MTETKKLYSYLIHEQTQYDSTLEKPDTVFQTKDKAIEHVTNLIFDEHFIVPDEDDDFSEDELKEYKDEIKAALNKNNSYSGIDFKAFIFEMNLK